MTKKAICIGGDKRFSYIRDILGNETDIQNANIVILPFSPEKELLFDIFKELKNDQIVVYGGTIPKKYRDTPNAICYSKSEEFLQKNARLTAEAILGILIDNLETSFCDSNIAVTGFGRIGKELYLMLNSLGCSPKIFSCKGVNLVNDYCDFERLAKSFDCVINTAPALVLDRQKLSALHQNCLLVEVASKPYGIDFKAAEDLGLKYIIASSLPGKKSPVTAAKIILEEIDKISFKGE